MKQFIDMLTVTNPTEIEEKREGVIYPEFNKYTYYSKTAERDTNMNVLLPINYSEDKKYPVLYILHGYFDNEDWMARDDVKISTMLTNLCADGEAEEMIVVLPYIFCSKDMPACTGLNLQNSLCYDNFINDLLTDVMPFVEKNFSVKTGRENTAITGFSMGGRESIFIGIKHPELFGYIGAVCPAPGLVPVPVSGDHPGQLEEKDLVFKDISPYVFLISASVKDTVVIKFPYNYHEMLLKNNTEHLWISTETDHNHTSVKPHLYNFFRIIFKEGK